VQQYCVPEHLAFVPHEQLPCTRALPSPGWHGGGAMVVVVVDVVGGTCGTQPVLHASTAPLPVGQLFVAAQQ